MFKTFKTKAKNIKQVPKWAEIVRTLLREIARWEVFGLMVTFGSIALSLHFEIGWESAFISLQSYWVFETRVLFCSYHDYKVNQVKHKKVKFSKPPIYKERKRLAQGEKQFWYAIKDIQKE